MMSLETIIAINEEIAARAARRSLRPLVPNGPEDVDRWKTFPFPNLGYHEPEGWHKVESWFIDKTGHGYEWEPALTQQQFREVLRDHITEHPGDGFAITEEGPFQAVVSAFRKTGLELDDCQTERAA